VSWWFLKLILTTLTRRCCHQRSTFCVSNPYLWLDFLSDRDALSNVLYRAVVSNTAYHFVRLFFTEPFLRWDQVRRPTGWFCQGEVGSTVKCCLKRLMYAHGWFWSRGNQLTWPLSTTFFS
jgi:hypothetical protein